MANGDSKPPAPPHALRPPDQPTASFGQQVPVNNVLVNVTADNLNIHPSSISALERIAEKSPEIASQLIRSADRAVESDARKYVVSAAAAGVVALSIIIGSAVVIIEAGTLAGLFFFMACVAASAVITAIFTGKPQDLSWTVKLLHRGGSADDDEKS